MRNYISKINDRNLQRKRESGLTTYALYSVIVLIMYKITELYPLIPFRTNFWFIIRVLSYTSVITLCSVLIMILYDSTSTNSSSIRVVWKSKKHKGFFDNMIVASFFLIPLLTSLFIFVNSYLKNHNVEIYFLANLLLSLLFFSISFISTKSGKLNNYYEIFEGTGNSGVNLPFFDATLFFIFAADILLSFYNIYQLESNIGKINILGFGVLLMTIPLLVERINTLRQIDTFANDLENLEYEINIMNLQDDQIRERLQKYYMGFILSEWINYHSREINNYIITLLQSRASIQTMLEGLGQIDKQQYPIEYNGRAQQILSLQKSLLNNFENFFVTKKEEIKLVLKEPRLDPNEKIHVMKFLDFVDAEYKKYKE